MTAVDKVIFGTKVRVPFTTNNTSGGKVAPSSDFLATDIFVYKDDSQIQKTTNNGITISNTYDTRTGLTYWTADTSVATGDAGFWAHDTKYMVVLEPPSTTVDGQSVIEVLREFRTYSLAELTAFYPEGRVVLDKNAINTNTVVGIDGTLGNPVSTLAAAITIADQIGKRLIVIGNFDDVTGDLTDYDIVAGSGDARLDGDITSGIILKQATIRKVQLSGDLIMGADTKSYDCQIVAITQVGGTNRGLDGIHYFPLLEGSSEIVSGANLNTIGGADRTGSTVNFHFNGTGVDVNISDFAGTILVRDMTVGSHVLVVNSGGSTSITLLSSCTLGSAIFIGIGNLTDSSAGTSVTLNQWQELPIGDNNPAKSALYQGAVWFDSAAANTNSVFGTDGIPTNKVSAEAAAKTLLPSVGTRLLRIAGTLTLTGSWNDLTKFEGQNLNSILVFNNQDAADNTFSRIVLQGIMNVASDGTVFVSCIIDGVSNIGGIARACIYQGSNTISDTTGGNAFTDYFGSSIGNATFDFAGLDRNAIFRFWTGDMVVNNMNSSSSSLLVVLAGGTLVLNPSCTAGAIVVIGEGKLLDNSGGSTTVDISGLGVQHWSGENVISAGANMIADDGSGNKRWTAKALELAPTSGDATAANQTSIAAQNTAIQSDVTLIKSKTNNLPHSVKRATALPNFYIDMDDVNGDPLGSAVVTVELSQDGAPYGPATNSPASFLSDGTFVIDFTIADTTGASISIKGTAVGANMTKITLLTEVT